MSKPDTTLHHLDGKDIDNIKTKNGRIYIDDVPMDFVQILGNASKYQYMRGNKCVIAYFPQGIKTEPVIVKNWMNDTKIELFGLALELRIYLYNIYKKKNITNTINRKKKLMIVTGRFVVEETNEFLIGGGKTNFHLNLFDFKIIKIGKEIEYFNAETEYERLMRTTDIKILQQFKLQQQKIYWKYIEEKKNKYYRNKMNNNNNINNNS